MERYEKPIETYRGYVKIEPDTENNQHYSDFDYSGGVLTECEINGVPQKAFPDIIGECVDNRTGERNFIARAWEKGLVSKVLGRKGQNNFIVPASKVKSKFLVPLQEA